MDFKELITETTKANKILKIEKIQSLWNGYGEIVRIYLEGSKHKSVVLKHVKFPSLKLNPLLESNSNLSHKRKIRSYEVETFFYTNFSSKCNEIAPVPQCLFHQSRKEEILILLEDLKNLGYPYRKNSITKKEIFSCIKWLARFHALFLGEKPLNLWPIGTYWHLDTRPEELEALDDIPLKKAAEKINEILNNAKYQTFVHGDAKLANFIFSKNGYKAAAVDFQYTGGGIGMKDLAYFIGSVYCDNDCEKVVPMLLDFYFNEFEKVLNKLNSSFSSSKIEKEWRRLFPFAWADFHRFIKGWSPNYWNTAAYSEKITKKVLSVI